jgi:putative NIF3 family GTP cyclohydrolase 1 type 2
LEPIAPSDATDNAVTVALTSLASVIKKFAEKLAMNFITTHAFLRQKVKTFIELSTATNIPISA